MTPLANAKTQRLYWPWVALLATLFLAARVYCATVFRVDSDEPQHLHVVWGVARGLVQYRDIFDNHSPLFQLLCAPLFRAFGERADIVVVMRLAMVPLYFGALACIYLLCSRLFSRQCGVLATLFTAVHPRFFCTSLEFRPDNLWVFCWLLALAALLCIRRHRAQWFLSGLLLGACFSVSMKTTVMALDLAIAGILTWLLCRTSETRISLVRFAKDTMLFLSGLVLIPGALLHRFEARGALANLYYCLIQHNLIAATERAHWIDLRGFAVLAAFAAILWWCRRIIRTGGGQPLVARRVFLLLAGGIYPVLLFIVWPLVTREDYLALLPMIGMVLAPALIAVLQKLRERRPQFAWTASAVPACLVLALLALDLRAVKPWRNRTRFQESFVANALKLTDPGDFVMDPKGEMIYRDRPFYFVLEEMTRWRFKRGRLTDDLPERMIAHSVCVAAKNGERYPGRTVKFLKENFIPVSFRLLVAGKILTPAPANAPTPFQIAIHARYALLGAGDSGAILLDGKKYEGPVTLAPGPHTIQAPAGTGRVALVWAQAIERGFKPFYRSSTEEKSEAEDSIRENIL